MNCKRNNILRLLCLLVVAFSVGACDMMRKNKCEWYLTPEPKHRDLVEPGWVSLCARNYELQKQKCYIAAPLEVAENIYGKPVRYVDIELDKSFPRKILSVKQCGN